MNFESIANNRIFVGFLSIILGVIYARNRKSISNSYWFSITLCFIGIWCILDYLQIYTRNYEHKSIANIQILVFIISEFLTYSLMIFNFNFCNQKKTFIYKILRLFFIFPLILIIVVFFNGTKAMLTSELLSPKELANPLIGYFYKKNTLYFLHIFYCVFTLLVSLYLTIYSFFKENKLYKSVYISVFFAMILICVPTFNKVIIANFFSNSSFTIYEHISTFCVLFAVLLSFFTLYFDNSIICLEKAQSDFFNTCNFAVFIFNKQEMFLKGNQLAEVFLKKYNYKNNEKFSYADLKNNSVLQKIEVPNQIYSENSYFLYSVKTNENYLVKKNPIKNNSNIIQGWIVMLENIENYFNSMSEYDYPVIYDEETECVKGKYFESKLQNYLLKSDNAIIAVANLKNLAEISEQNGLKKASSALSRFAKILKSTTNNSEIFRISSTCFGFIIDSKKIDFMKSIFNTIRLECNQYFIESNIKIKCRLGYTISDSKKSAVELIDESVENMMLDQKN